MDIKNSLKPRENWIDMLRALAVLFVVYGHQVSNANMNWFYVFTSPIKIPLFFVITGYVFNTNKEPRLFLYDLFRKMIVPWLVFSITPIVILTPVRGVEYLIANVHDILLGKSVWYMPCCIIGEIIWYFTFRVTSNKNVLRVVIALIISSLGFFLIENAVLDVFMINRAMLVQMFLLNGSLIARYKERYKTIPRIVISTTIVLYVLLAFFSLQLYPDQSLDIHTGNFYNFTLCLGMILIGCHSLFALGLRWNPSEKVLSSVGRNTMFIYILSPYMLEVLSRIFSKILISLPIGCTALIYTVITTFILNIVAVYLKKKIPWLFGRSSGKLFVASH